MRSAICRGSSGWSSCSAWSMPCRDFRRSSKRHQRLFGSLHRCLRRGVDSTPALLWVSVRCRATSPSRSKRSSRLGIRGRCQWLRQPISFSIAFGRRPAPASYSGSRPQSAFCSGSTMEIVATHSPLAVADRRGDAGSCVVGLASLDRQPRLESRACRALDSTPASISARPVGDVLGAALEQLDALLLRQVSDNGRRPDAGQFSGTRVPARGRDLQVARPIRHGEHQHDSRRRGRRRCTVSPASRHRSCISWVATPMKSSERA